MPGVLKNAGRLFGLSRLFKIAGALGIGAGRHIQLLNIGKIGGMGYGTVDQDL